MLKMGYISSKIMEEVKFTNMRIISLLLKN